MSGKPVPLDLARHADLVAGAREFLRMGARGDGRGVCFVTPVPIGPDPAALGIALVDVVRHGARAYARAVSISEAEATARIWAGVDAERAQATDLPHEAEDDALPPDDDFISYTSPRKPH